MTDSDETKAGPVKRGPGRPRKDAPETSERQETFKREPFGGLRFRLQIPEEMKDPGYHYAWIKDEGDNLYRARRNGYSECSYKELGRIADRDQDEKDPCTAHGGVGEAGRPYKMYAMKKPMEFYLEDKAAAAKLADDIDASIYREEFEEGRYGTHNVQVKNEE